MRYLLVGLVALALAPAADAHRLHHPHGDAFPGLHKICSALTLCHDRAPRVDPPIECNPSRDGMLLKVWDDNLGAFVRWECRCLAIDECHWFRRGIVQRKRMPWQRPRYRTVIDFQRACDSIVCEYVAVEHRYPTKAKALWR